MRLLYKSEPIRFAPAALVWLAPPLSLSETILPLHGPKERFGGLLTAVVSTYGSAFGGAMHARGRAVVVGYSIEAHVF
jgi:hypothetical protein